ncbi:TIGR03084 family metal-binding protein [Streptomyces arenae]|uniref:TIGR03084 family metal-binding protein n=1 Tax=Streptomyces arenae TaxID=29301 RepID=UPI00265ABC05|nr:TIGR03084 family metal-binding protein [Streptomyces arenae]MCG7203687.1 TIGR03084 family metal-binding protein [Streptomyces arenae]
MAVFPHRLTEDLDAESADLRRLVAPLDETGWRLPTPAAGWSVLDQLTHLAHYDEAAVMAACHPERFAAEAARQPQPTPDDIAARHRSLSGADALDWYDRARRRLIEVFAELDPRARLPWYGPPMSAATCLTARIMETWAHGQDVADALGVTREPTARLRHIAHLGVGTREFSYTVNGVEPPGTPVRVGLSAPDGQVWTWGPPEAACRVEGSAQDFCLVVTRRRTPERTRLLTLGDEAGRWLRFAQVFAGPPSAASPSGRRG